MEITYSSIPSSECPAKTIVVFSMITLGGYLVWRWYKRNNSAKE